MEGIMTNEYKITKKLIMSWAKEYHLHGVANKILFAIWIFAAVLGTGGIILCLYVGSDWKVVCLYALILLLSVYKLFVARFVVWSRRYKMMAKTYGVAEWMRRTEFSEDKITLSDHNSITELHYENIEKIKEKGNVVMIFLNHNQALRLYKDSFISGSWQECKTLIDEKSKK